MNAQGLDLPAEPTEEELGALYRVLDDDWMDEAEICEGVRYWAGPEQPNERTREILNYLASPVRVRQITESRIVDPGGLEPMKTQWRYKPLPEPYAKPGALAAVDAQIEDNERFISDSLPPLHDTAEERQKERDQEKIGKRAAAMQRGDEEDLPVREGGTGKGWVWDDEMRWVRTPGEYHKRKKVQDPDKTYWFDGRNNGQEGRCDCPYNQNDPDGFCKHQHRYNLRQAERRALAANVATKPLPQPRTLTAQEIDELWT